MAESGFKAGSSLDDARISTGVEEPRGVLGHGLAALDQLRRPQSGAFAFAQELLETGNPLSAISEGLEELWEFDKKLTFQDVLDAGGLPEFPGRGVVEFGGDIFLDPLFIIPTGLIGTGIKKGVSLTGKWANNGAAALQNWGVPGIVQTGKATKAVRDKLHVWFTGAHSRVGKELVEEQKKVALTVNRFLREQGHQSQAIEVKLREMAADEFGVALKEVTEDQIQTIRTAWNAITERSSSTAKHLSVQGEDLLSAELGPLVDAETVDGLVDFQMLQKMAAQRDRYVPARAYANLNPRNKELLEKFSRDRKDLFEFLIAKDADIQALVHSLDPLEVEKGIALASERLGYLPHIINPEAKEHLIRNFSKFADKGLLWNTEHDSLLRRVLTDVSILEGNEAALNGMIDIIPKGMSLFIDDPNLIDAVRSIRTVKEMATVNFIDGAAKKFGFVEKSAVKSPKGIRVKKEAIGPDGKSRLIRELKDEGYELMKIPGYTDTLVPQEAARILNSTWEAFNDPKAYSKLVQYFKSSTSLYKLWTLSVFPEYTGRNVASNLNNMRLAGMDNPFEVAEFIGLTTQLQIQGKKVGFISDDLKDFFFKGELGKITKQWNKQQGDKTLAKMSGKLFGSLGKHRVKDLDAPITLGKTTQTAREWLSELDQVGALSGGLIGGEIMQAESGRAALAKAGGKASRAIKKQILGEPGSFVAKGAAINSAVESNAKGALYLWARSKGKTVLEAKNDFMHKYLFDYLNPDPFTKAMRDSLFPFITWTRFNVPLQVEHLFQTPGKQALIAKVRASIEANQSTDQNIQDRYVAEWIRQGMSIRTRRNPDGGYAVFVLNNWIPIADLAEVGAPQLAEGVNSFSRGVGDWALGMLSPAIKLPVETATQYSMFYGRKFLPENRKFLGVNLPEWAINILRSVRVLSVMDRFVASPRDKDLGRELIRTLTGIYTTEVDLNKGAEFAAKEFNAKLRELEQAKRRSLRHGNDASAEDMQRQIDDLIERSQD